MHPVHITDQFRGIALLQRQLSLRQILLHGGDKQPMHGWRQADPVLQIIRLQGCIGGIMDANRQLGRRCTQGGQGLTQCGQAQGLDQPYIHSSFQAALPFFTQGIGGHTNNRHPRVKLTQAARQLIAIESGHIDVGDQQIK